ncbi:hypothetical protein D3C72_2111140 [compost metagenome]
MSVFSSGTASDFRRGKMLLSSCTKLPSLPSLSFSSTPAIVLPLSPLMCCARLILFTGESSRQMKSILSDRALNSLAFMPAASRAAVMAPAEEPERVRIPSSLPCASSA